MPSLLTTSSAQCMRFSDLADSPSCAACRCSARSTSRAFLVGGALELGDDAFVEVILVVEEPNVPSAVRRGRCCVDIL